MSPEPSYKLHVLPWNFEEKDQSSTRPRSYHADIAPWAIASSTSPTCDGAATGALAPAERFRITGLSVVSEKSREGAELEGLRVNAVVAGVYGAVAIRERPNKQAGAPAPPVATDRTGDMQVTSVQTTPQPASERPQQMAMSAICNAGGLRDFQIGNDRRVWAVRRDDLSVVRLLGPGQDACEGPSLAMASKGDHLRRAYAPPRSDGSNPNLQVLDLTADNEVIRLTVAKPPGEGGSEATRDPINAPAACGVSETVEPGSCDKGILAAALGQANHVSLATLLRDTSTDPGLERGSLSVEEFQESVERVTHLTVTGLAEGGKNTVVVVPFPLVSGFVPQSFRIPEDGKILALLNTNGGSLLLAAFGNTVKAYDQSGKERGSVDVEEQFLKSTSRLLVAATRVVLVARGNAGAAAAMKVLDVKDGMLTAPKCDGCTLQTDPAILELSRQLRIEPWLNPEGRIERFLTNEDLSTFVVARLGDDRKWQSWTGVSLDGGPVLELKSAGAGIPIVLEGDWAMIAPQPQTVERWSTKR